MTREHDAAVLVAEDNPTNQVALKALLNHFGVSADFVADGFEAVKAFNSGKYRLILMDLMMPGMDGYEAAKQIRLQEYGSGSHIPIVAVTAADTESSKTKCVEAGMDDFISKPIDHKELKHQLERWLLPSLAASLIQEMHGQDSVSVPISREKMQELYGTEDIGEILDSFLNVTDKLLERLKTAIEAQDLSSAGYIAHEVKGSSLAVSAEEMVYLSRELEKAIQAETWVEVIKAYSALATAFKRVTESMKAPVSVIVQGL
jgi:Response regulators consisting of a CheY-like receiver domain and a winged-helix DNA-binding domain